MTKLSNYQLLGLYVGGEDGGSRQDAADAFTGECHMIRILSDSTSFTVLTTIDQAGSTVNKLTANNLAGKTWDKGDLVFCGFGRYFSAFTSAAEVEYYVMPGTDRTQEQA
jgi:hypothetical protein